MKRRLAKERTAGRITDAAVAAYRRGDWLGLHRALGLRPWQPSPLDATTDEPPSWAAPRDGWREGWPLARALRAELEERL